MSTYPQMLKACLLGAVLLGALPTPAHADSFADSLTVVSGHPRMLVTAEGLPALRARCRPGGARAQEYQRLKAMVDGWLSEFSVRANEGQRRDQPLQCALVYLVEGDARYARLAKRYLDWFIANKQFIEYRGYGALNIAIDWLYDSFTPAEKQKYLGAAARYNVDWDAARGYAANHYPKRAPSNLNAVHGAGFYTAGLLLVGDPDPAFARAGREILDRHGRFFVEFVVPSYNVAASTYGGWSENGGSGGHTAMAMTLGVLLDAWDTATGSHLLARSSFARGLPVFFNYLQRGDGSLPGRSYDSEINNGPHSFIPLYLIVAKRLRSPYARRLADLMEAPSYVRAHWDILYGDDGVSAIDLKTLPRARLFDGPGYVAMRSGWAIGDREHPSGDTFIGFQCGDWYASHQQHDQGSFTIHKRVPLAIDPKGKTYGHAYDHNCIVVGGADQLDKAPGRPVDYSKPLAGTTADIADIIAFEDAPDWSYVFGDVTRAYDPAAVSLLTRRLVYLRPDVLVICDRVETKEPTADAKWLLHSFAESRSVGADLHRWDAGPTRMFVRTLLPEQVQFTEVQFNKDREKDFTEFVVQPVQTSTATTFLYVISLGDPSSEAVPAELVREQGMVGVKVKYRGRTWTVLFRERVEIRDKHAPLAGHVTIEDHGQKLVDRDFTDAVRQPALPGN